MITLSIPATINSVIGGNTPVNYNKFILSNIRFDSETKNITADIKLTSTANPDMTAIPGTLRINFAGANVEIQVPQLDFYRRVLLSGPQQNAIATLVSDAQTSVENGLISLGLVAGTQSAGV